MAPNVSDFFWQRLSEWGVKRVTLKNAAAMMATLAKGDPEVWDMLKDTAKDLVQSYLPHGGGRKG